MAIGPITDSIIEGFISEIKKKEVREKIVNNICYPLLSKYYSYFFIIVLILSIILLLLIIIIVLLVKKY